jgi:hypothetical protein
MDSMRKDLAEIMRTAALDVSWRDIKTRNTAETYEQMIVVQLRGSCQAGGSTSQSTVKVESLATSAVSGEAILPFVDLYCDRVSSLVQPVIAREPAYRANLLLGRAMARVLAHELYHILAQVQHHRETGLAKSNFGVREILSSSFQYDEAALMLMRKTVPAPSSPEQVVVAEAFDER